MNKDEFLKLIDGAYEEVKRNEIIMDKMIEEEKNDKEV